MLLFNVSIYVPAETDKKVTGLKLTHPVHQLVEIYSDLRKITDCMK